jgi:peroxiredoxin (alkyl hydroperoxide reductase subunit C)
MVLLLRINDKTCSLYIKPIKNINKQVMKKLFLIAGIMILSLNLSQAQISVNQRIPLIGNEAPSFRAMSTNGQISFPADFGNNWKIIFAHPRSFTPVCSTEILELAYQEDAFKQLGAKILVVSSDQLESHESWKTALEELSFKDREPVKINFPLIDDASFDIANSYGMLDSQSEIGQSIRGVFFIDPENKIRAFYFYPNEVGRSVNEIKRTLIALQKNQTDQRALLPEGWQPGDDVMVSFLSPEEKSSVNTAGSALYNVAWFMTYKKEGSK